MAIDITVELQGSTDTEVDATSSGNSFTATDRLQFSDGTFNGDIDVGSYNDSMHVDAGGTGTTDDASGNTPVNVQYISGTEGDWGGGTEDLDQITNAEATLKVTVTNDVAVALSNIKFYAYDGSTTTAVPTAVTFYGAEVGDTSWTNCEGSGSALSLSDSASATSHTFYIAVSASPESSGAKTAFRYRLTATAT